MALLPIIYAPDPRLKIKCRPVETVDQSVRDLTRDMLETMYAAPGIGLSAPQIGDTRRILVCDVTREGEDRQPIQLVNPEIVWSSGELYLAEEGCLSLPDHFAEIERPSEVRIRYLDQQGESQEMSADGLLAACVQHEMDHLEGILFVDYLSPLKRNIILRKMKKLKRQKEAA
ncbi:MAG: peptide deformylase [Alphaproteobacteria bacterium]|nr:peptide deformylase [Alphaproteobacteria bacterium]